MFVTPLKAHYTLKTDGKASGTRLNLNFPRKLLQRHSHTAHKQKETLRKCGPE